MYKKNLCEQVILIFVKNMFFKITICNEHLMNLEIG